MKIDKLIEELLEVQRKHGNLECVVETQDFLERMVFSTAEKLRIANFQGDKAILIDWRCC